MKKILLLSTTLLLIFCLTVPIKVYSKEPTAKDYLESARQYYNNPNLQLEDIYENMSWVGIGPAPKPDKPGITVPTPDKLPQTGEEVVITELLITFGVIFIFSGICLLGYNRYKNYYK